MMKLLAPQARPTYLVGSLRLGRAGWIVENRSSMVSLLRRQPPSSKDHQSRSLLCALSPYVPAEMEDIEDLVAVGGAPPGFRLPLTTVGVKPKKKRQGSKLNGSVDSAKLSSPSNSIPGTQVRLTHLSLSVFWSSYRSKIFAMTSPYLCLDSFCRPYISRHSGALTTRYVVLMV